MNLALSGLIDILGRLFMSKNADAGKSEGDGYDEIDKREELPVPVFANRDA